MSTTGKLMYKWAKDLFPIARSLTGPGVRLSLDYIQNIIPDLKIHDVPTGYKAFDWVVPDEWTILDAFIKNEQGERIVDFNENNLHVLGYSIPIDKWLSRDELLKHVYSLPDQPDTIPYVTSYYKRRWGFCISDNQKKQLPEGKYHAVIKSELKPGVLNYADIIIPGETDEEIMFSTYICHPSMANNELSGPVLATALAKYLRSKQDNYYTYRIVFVPETIGSIIYLSKHLTHLQKNVQAGYVLTCVGDERAWSFMPSRNGNTLSDRAARFVLKNSEINYEEYSFLKRGSDERQYCSPGVDLPFSSVMRSKYGTYPEYHTSDDNLDLITANGLQQSYDVYKSIINLLEHNLPPKATVLCEPQLGKRGLYPDLSIKGGAAAVRNMMNIYAYSDGKNDLIELLTKTNVGLEEGLEIIKKFQENKLLE